MYWIRTHKGNGVNLALASSLEVTRVDDVWQLRAYAPMLTEDGEQAFDVIDEDGEQEMKDKRDAILNELVLRQAIAQER